MSADDAGCGRGAVATSAGEGDATVPAWLSSSRMVGAVIVGTVAIDTGTPHDRQNFFPEMSSAPQLAQQVGVGSAVTVLVAVVFLRHGSATDSPAITGDVASSGGAISPAADSGETSAAAGATDADSCAVFTGVPHAGQNFLPRAISAPQLEQRVMLAFSAALLAAGLSFALTVMRAAAAGSEAFSAASTSRVPHFPQKDFDIGNSAPQEGHILCEAADAAVSIGSEDAGGAAALVTSSSDFKGGSAAEDATGCSAAGGAAALESK